MPTSLFASSLLCLHLAASPPIASSIVSGAGAREEGGHLHSLVTGNGSAERLSEGGEGGEAAVALAPFVANLRGDDDEDRHYLKISLSVSMKDPKLAKAFEGNVPRVRNNVLVYLRGLRVSDTEGSENMRKIGERLTKEVQEAGGKDAVGEVNITEFLVQ